MSDSPVLSPGSVVIFHGYHVNSLPLWADGEAGIVIEPEPDLTRRQPSELGSHYVINARGQVNIIRMRHAQPDDTAKPDFGDLGCTEFFRLTHLVKEGGIPVTVFDSSVSL